MKEKFLSNTQLRALLSLATEDERLGITKILDNNANNALSSAKLQNMISLEGGHGFVNFFREQGTGYIDILDDVVSELNIKGLPSYQSKLQFIDEVERINSQDSKYNEAEAIQQGLSYCEQAELKVIQELIKRSYEYLEKQKNKVEKAYRDSIYKHDELVLKREKILKVLHIKYDEAKDLYREINQSSEFFTLVWICMHQDDWVWPYLDLVSQNPCLTQEMLKDNDSRKLKVTSSIAKIHSAIEADKRYNFALKNTKPTQSYFKDFFNSGFPIIPQGYDGENEISELEKRCNTLYSEITETIKTKYQYSKKIILENERQESLLLELNKLKRQLEEFDNSINQVVNEFGDNNHSGLVGTAGLMAIANLGGFATYTLLTSFMSAVSFGSLGFGAYTAATSLLSIAIGPVGWIALGSYAVFSLGKPSMSKLMPIVATVGAIRQRIKYEN